MKKIFFDLMVFFFGIPVFGFVVIFWPYGTNIISAYWFWPYGPARALPVSIHWDSRVNIYLR